jgi:putative ABC transport system substrate-binding protein
VNNRREFISLVGGAAATWPLAARAQQADRMRRIGALLNLAADDPMGQARVAAFVQGLQAAGWSDGRNVRIDTRWAAADPGNYRKYAARRPHPQRREACGPCSRRSRRA